MNLFSLSLTGLIILYFGAYFCDLVFKIRKDKFYRPFHFLGGFLTSLFWLSLTKNYLVSIGLTFLTTLLWEVYEWLLWKYLFKNKPSAKPKKKDTQDDITLGIIGGVTSLFLYWLIF